MGTLPAPIGQETASQRLTDLIPPEQWSVYARFITETAGKDIPFALGGGLAVSVYSAYVRNTKDMDIYLREQDSRRVIEITRELGFQEYTEFPYDPTWSYRSARNGYIIDFLWRMLNGKASVDETWLTRGWELRIRGVSLRVIPVEELILSKLYILKMDRTDWPDILSLLYAQGVGLDWERLLSTLGDDRPLLGSVMNVLRWLCPGRACRFPESIWAPLGLLPPTSSHPEVDQSRLALLNAEHLFGELP
ncbi:nucleotidyltransferase [Geomonas sp.]|uniref:nucleotidyltransferase n=1 Tax=Geomonas sp. TaxID=2651584 RepID=UPI002B49AB6A|nr:nucleotidyltransferase [Geomonas sp.]HJV36726.1 nucleotidyltransferase [Geomonas sp.]